MDDKFIKLMKTEMASDLLECHPNAFLLLTLIAVRARRATPNLIKNLDICECHIGDYRSCGLTEQKYRTAKKVLEDNGLATFCATNKGTVAKIMNTAVYDINSCDDNGQVTDKKRSSNGQPTGSQRLTKNVRMKECEECKENTPPKSGEEESFEKFWKMYGKPVEKKKCRAKWKRIKSTDQELIFKNLPAYIKATPDRQYRKNPSTYLNNECWNDEIIKETKNGKTQHNYTGKDDRPSVLEDRLPDFTKY